MEVSPLDRLPIEVLSLIALSCEKERDIAAWSVTARRYHEIVGHLLYDGVVSRRDWSVVFDAARVGNVGTLGRWASICNAEGVPRAALDIYKTNRGHGALQFVGGPMDGSAQMRYARFWTPLHEAARGGHREAVEFLLDHGADIDAPSFGLLPHSLGVFRDARDRASSSVPGCVTLSPLHVAVILGREEVALLLLERGADLRVMPLRGGPPSRVSALHLAAAYGMLSVVRVLGQRSGIDVNEPDADGQPPLVWAAENEAGHPALDVLRSVGADLDCTMSDAIGGQEPLLVILIRRVKWRAAAEIIDLGAQLDSGRGRAALLEECERAKMSVIYPAAPDLAWDQLAKRLNVKKSRGRFGKHWPFARREQKA